MELDLLSSVTSTSVNNYSTAFRLPAGHAYWTRLDGILIRLVGRLERRLRLKVEFWDVGVTWSGRLNVGTRLPVFVKIGRMEVFDSEDGLIYCVREQR